MEQTLNLIQIILGILLTLLILLQQKGAGLGSTFGGDASLYRTKRGAERLLFRITILLSILLFVSIIGGLLV